MKYSNSILVDNSGLTEIANSNFGNKCILDPIGSFKRDYLSPLVYLHPYNRGAIGHFLVIKSGIVLASASVTKFESADDNQTPATKFLQMYGLCVRPFQRNKGLARGLMSDVFSLACEEGRILTTTHFTAKGRKYLAPTIAKIHCESYPNVPVLFPGLGNVLKGNPAYNFADPTILKKLKESLNKLLTLSP